MPVKCYFCNTGFVARNWVLPNKKSVDIPCPHCQGTQELPDGYAKIRNDTLSRLPNKRHDGKATLHFRSNLAEGMANEVFVQWVFLIESKLDCLHNSYGNIYFEAFTGDLQPSPSGFLGTLADYVTITLAGVKPAPTILIFQTRVLQLQILRGALEGLWPLKPVSGNNSNAWGYTVPVSAVVMWLNPAWNGFPQ